DYFTDVKVNSESITFGIYLFEYEDTLISMSMNYSSDDAIYWTLNFGKYAKRDQNRTLHQFSVPVTKMFCIYLGTCCVPPEAPFSDVPAYEYTILESDSNNNILSVHVDTLLKSVSGNYAASFVNVVAPFDTVNIKCDTFYCVWK
ncbi:MAG: hypothetical protein ABIO46_04995, partial [Chitinophagales bacterium]